MIERLLRPLSSTARSLLEKERKLEPEDEAMRQRILERARAALEADRPSGVSLRLANRNQASRARAGRSVLLIAAAVGVAGLAAAGAGVFARGPVQVPSARQALPILRASAAVPTTPRQAANAVEMQPTATPTVVEPRPAAVAPAESSHAPNASTYALELGLLEPARSSIAHGDFGAALTAVARHQREYPHGQLTEEREALRVRALWGMGQKAAAEGAAVTFRKRYPRSGLLNWMKAAVTPQ
jgi:hypothetical protein